MTLGPYTLRAPLGSGAYAVVWEAEDQLGRRFALKVQHVGSRAGDRRFHREFDALRALRIPGVVRVHATGHTRGAAWFVMDLIRGETFVDAIASTSLVDRVSGTIRLGRQLGEALAGIHAAGFTHRDIKPSNVMVDGHGRVVVLDFGLARATDAVDADTGSGHVVGTVPYMAPEQIAGLPTDHRVDLYALGLLLHEAVAGPRPKPSTPVGWITRTCLERLPALAALGPAVPLGLSALVDALTDIEPTRRPSAAEVAARLAGLALEDDTSELPEPPWVDRDAALGAIEGTFTHNGPRVVILEGAAGSGRRRLIEVTQRHATVGGVWVLHGRCRVSSLGGALAEILATLVSRDDEGLAPMPADDREAMANLWPEVLPPTRGTAVPTLSGVATAFVRLIGEVAKQRKLLLVFHDIDQVDALSARAIVGLAAEGVGCVVTVDPRWRAPRTERLVRGLVGHGASVCKLAEMPAAMASRIASGVAPTVVSTPALPRAAAELGWKQLMADRGAAWSPPAAELWPLAVLDDYPVPVGVAKRLIGRAWASDPDVVRTDTGIALRGRGTLASVRARMADRAAAASDLARAWEAEGRDVASERDHAADAIATAWLLAGRPARAREACIEAALRAVERGRPGAARRWLAVADTLPEAAGARPAFDVAFARASVLLRTSPSPNPAALEAAEAIATTDADLQRVRVLRAEHALRHDRPTEALVGALRQASQVTGGSDPVRVEALCVAGAARITLGQLDEADQVLTRARALVAGRASPMLGVLAAQIAFERGRPEGARTLGLAALSDASEVGNVEVAAAAAAVVARAQRQLGHRLPAEHQARAALDGFSEAGDPRKQAEASLDLVTLLVERGDAARARPILQRLLRTDLPTRERARAVRVALALALAIGDDSAPALHAELMLRAHTDDEAPAALVRAHLLLERRLALDVDPPARRGYGLAMWRIERARAALELGRGELCAQEAAEAHALAAAAGLRELLLMADLLRSSATAPAEAWAALQRDAAQSLALDVYLTALELDARRAPTREASGRWRALRVRAEELGHRPTIESADRFL